MALKRIIVIALCLLPLLVMASVKDTPEKTKASKDNTIKDEAEDILANTVEDNFDVLSFTKGYFDKRRTKTLTLQDAIGLIIKLSDSKRNGAMYAKKLEELYSSADTLASRIASCDVTKSKRVHDFVDAGTIAETLVKIKMLNDNWVCNRGTGANEKDSMPKNLMATLRQQIFEGAKKRLKEDPKGAIQAFVEFLKKQGILGKDPNPFVLMITDQLTQSDIALEYLIYFLEGIDSFAATKNGERLMEVLPQLLTSDYEKAKEIISSEFQNNFGALFQFLQNSDFSKQFSKQVAQVIIHGVKGAKDALNDNFKVAIANSMLLSNKLPPLDRKNLSMSASEIIEKLVALMTASRLNLDLHNRFTTISSEFERLYFKFDKFESLSEEELENVVIQFLSDNLLSPLNDAWTASNHVRQFNDCYDITLCLYNENHRKSNKIVKEIAFALSHAITYVSSSVLDSDKMHQAIHLGQDEKTTCQKAYQQEAANAENLVRKCDIFTQMKQRLAMDPNYEHTEL